MSDGVAVRLERERERERAQIAESKRTELESVSPNDRCPDRLEWAVLDDADGGAWAFARGVSTGLF